MKLFKRLFCLALALVLCAALMPAALAEDDSATEDLFEGKSWDEVVDGLLAKYDVTPSSVGLGYYNTVTGEEHYLNADEYMVAGSMYKVPLNMAFAEKVANGEMQWSDKIGSFTLAELRDETIIYSNNDLARTLWTVLNGNTSYHRYREIIAPLMGEDPETVSWKYYENNFFTPRQMIFCLKLLYDEQERFPTIIETMQQAEPKNYFKLRERRFNIAHKYGFLLTEYHQYINDCGIAFTDEPILLVAFTDNVLKAYDVLTEYCTLMCDYAQYHTALDRAEEEARAKAEAEALAKAEEEARQAQAEAELQATPRPLSSLFGGSLAEKEDKAELDSAPGVGFSPFLTTVVLIVVTLVALVLFIRSRRLYGLPLPWAIAGLLLFALALLLCIIGVSAGTLSVRTAGEPGDTVETFFAALDANDYDAAYACLGGDSRLGLEDEPSGEAAVKLCSALRDSYACSLIGESIQDGFTARQQVQLRYLDLSKLTPALETEALDIAASLAGRRSRSTVYGEDGGYLPEFSQEVYSLAMGSLLTHAEDYYTTAGVQLTLRYQEGGWYIVPDQALLKALSGGLSY